METKCEQAITLHDQGYNCAQAVLCTYCKQFGIEEETAYRIADGMGLGMGLMEVCGALSAAFLLAGLKNSGGTAAPGTTKASSYAMNRELGKAFEERTGAILCRDLKGVKTGTPLCSCPDCIRHACKVVEEQLL